MLPRRGCAIRQVEERDAPDLEQAATSLPYKPGLDGVRAIAVIAVLTFHSGFAWAQGGYLGVSLFFTLSGYLITRLLVAERAATGRINLLAFWARRLRRLLPAATLTLVGVVVLASLVATPMERAGLRDDILATIGYVANWRFMLDGSSYADLFASPSFVQHFWSLAIEEQFYFVFPCVVAGVLALTRGSRRLLMVAIVGLAMASLAVALTAPGSDRVYYGTDTRAFELLAGAFLGVVTWGAPSAVRRRPSKWFWAGAGPVALIATLYLWHSVGLDTPSLYVGGLAGVAVVSTFVVQSATMPGLVSAVLGFAPFRALGRISYGVYLFHWPLFLWLDEARTGLAGWGLFALRVGVTLAIAQISYVFVESPVRSGRRLRTPRFTLFVPVSFAAVVVMAIVVVGVPDSDQVIDAADFERAAEIRAPEPADTRLVDSDGVPRPLRIYVIGDSTGLTFVDGLNMWGTATSHIAVTNGSVTGCGLLVDGQLGFPKDHTWLGPEVISDCDSWPTRWPADIESTKPDLVLVVMGPANTVDVKLPGDNTWRALGDPLVDDLLARGLNDAADLLAEAGVAVLWFDSPYLGADSLELVGAQASHQRMDVYNRLVRELVVDEPLIDLFPWRAYVATLTSAELERLRPDGIHVAAGQLGVFLDKDLWAQIRAAYIALARGSST